MHTWKHIHICTERAIPHIPDFHSAIISTAGQAVAATVGKIQASDRSCMSICLGACYLQAPRIPYLYAKTLLSTQSSHSLSILFLERSGTSMLLTAKLNPLASTLSSRSLLVRTLTLFSSRDSPPGFVYNSFSINPLGYCLQ